MKDSRYSCFSVMKSLDMIWHVMQNAGKLQNPKVIQHHAVIAHHKVTARACPQLRKKNPRQHLLLVSWDLHADVPWGRLQLPQQGHTR